MLISWCGRHWAELRLLKPSRLHTYSYIIAAHNFEGLKANVPAYVAVLIEAVFGEGTALEIHTQLHKQTHDMLVGNRPRLTVLFAVDDIV